MKKITVFSKVVFTICLFTLVISSVFALKATTKKVIIANNPSIYQINEAKAHRVTVSVTTDKNGNNLVGSDKAIHTGNFIHIKYKLEDIDGDKDSTSSVIMSTLVVFIRAKVLDGQDKTISEWRNITLQKPITYTINEDIATITFEVDTQFVGADKIGFKILERTEYGIPYVNHWINVTDILVKEEPYLQSAIKTNDINNIDIIGPTLPDLRKQVDKVKHEFGPGETSVNNGLYPVEGDLVKVGIFKYDAQGKLNTKVNYAPLQGTAPDLEYGDTFGVVVWNDENKNDLPDTKEIVLTESYKFNWRLVGTYENVVADEQILSAGVSGVRGEKIFLGSNSGKDHNAIYTTQQNNYKAGAQGFNLEIDAIPAMK